MKDLDLRKAYSHLLIGWIVILIILLLTSCNQRPYMLHLEGEVMYRYGNTVLIKFNHHRGKGTSYDHFYVINPKVKPGTKAKIIFE